MSTLLLAAAVLRLGAAWYPEQWPEDRWDRDLTLMEAAHLNVVRVGEFAWSALEPTEGHYDLDSLNTAWTTAYWSQVPLNDQPDNPGLLLDHKRFVTATWRAYQKNVGNADAPLEGYKLVLAPSLNVIPASLGEHLAAYVRGGGHLILGPRSGMKDELNRLDTRRHHRARDPRHTLADGRLARGQR